jgi:hypothetical protein
VGIARRLTLALTLVATLPPAQAWLLTINPGTRSVFLQVGNGSGTTAGNPANSTGANNATINVVSLSVPAAQLGNGTALAMTSNSTQTSSFYDGFAVCTLPQVYVGGYVRQSTGSGVLSVQTPSGLVNASGNVIPFSQIRWTVSSNGNDNNPNIISSGTFINNGTLTIATIPNNSWAENCHSFTYANSAVVAAGTYTGRATYTLTAP